MMKNHRSYFYFIMKVPFMAYKETAYFSHQNWTSHTNRFSFYSAIGSEPLVGEYVTLEQNASFLFVLKVQYY